MEDGIRKHDEFYANEDRSKNIKYSFECIIKLLKERRFDIDQIKLLDIGCASGDFLFAVRELCGIPAENLAGADLLDSLLISAREKLPEVLFFKRDISSDDFSMHLEYDVVTLIGVLQIFDEYETAIDNCIDCCASGGTVVVSGPFNPYPVDMLTRYRRVDAGEPQRQPLELGWNIFSKLGLENFLSTHSRVASYHFHDIEFPESVALEPRPDDWLRSWTMESAVGKKFVNGNQIIQHHSILEILVR